MKLYIAMMQTLDLMHMTRDNEMGDYKFTRIFQKYFKLKNVMYKAH